MMLKPRIAITLGDPAGVGPELSLRLMTLPAVLEKCVPLLAGELSLLNQVAAACNLKLPSLVLTQPLAHDSLAGVDQPAVIDLAHLQSPAVQAGLINRQTGDASYSYVNWAIAAAIAGTVDAIVTGPINKKAWELAGVEFPGHTELLASLCNASRYAMMLTSDEITCSFVTSHVGLRDVPRLVTTERVLEVIQLSHEAMQKMRGRQVKLVACGLNPHAGEDGLFGDGEEEKVIAPAIARAREAGIDVEGPLPPDTAFLPSIRQATDCYVCMYHDQGLIPLKALAFDTAVNVTLGLPIIRTSVDHGTALDIAWQGKADVTSMVRAVELAVSLANAGPQAR